MPVIVETPPDNKSVVIKITGRFDFNVRQEFRDAYENVQSKDIKWVIDLGASEHMDSSALGMLLLLRDHIGGDAADIEVVNCKHDIKNILTSSNFQKLFTIRG